MVTLGKKEYLTVFADGRTKDMWKKTLATCILILLIGALCFYLAPIKIPFTKYAEFQKPGKYGTWWLLIEDNEERLKLSKDFSIDIPDIDFKQYNLIICPGDIRTLTFSRITKYIYKGCIDGEYVGKLKFKMLYTDKICIYKVSKVSLGKLSY